MRFGIVSPAIPGLVAQCETAEALGFDQAWLFDSHMVYADVYVIMALCAERTQRMCFGTGIAVAPSRIAPITAHSIATLNQLYRDVSHSVSALETPAGEPWAFRR